MSVVKLPLEGQAAIVTGGAGGMGRVIILALAEAGADVAVSDVSVQSQELAVVLEKIRRLGKRVVTVPTDISRKTEVDRMVQKVISEFGKVDILVNTAAKPIFRLLVHEISEEEWDQEISNNLKGYHLCCQAVIKTMKERRQGCIINFASVGGIKAGGKGGAYSISKAGVIMLTKMLAVELGSYSIRVNCIAPGTIKTNRTQSFWSDLETLKKIEANIPLGRIGLPEEIAPAVVFLASPGAAYITGQILGLDGGVLAT